MADLTVTYTLTTPGPDIVFNDGSLFSTDDLYWIQTLRGLERQTPELRTPVDSVAFGDGGLVHTFRKPPRRATFDGVLLVQSVSRSSSMCQQILNVMEDNLSQALESIEDADGTLTWTPTGFAQRTLTVRCEVPFDPQPIEDYQLRSFSFGLIAANPVWS